MKLRVMGVAMQQVELLSLEQIEEFLEGAEGIEFRAVRLARGAPAVVRAGDVRHLAPRVCSVHGRQEFVRLARISPAHLYNLHRCRAYLRQRRPPAKTRSAPSRTTAKPLLTTTTLPRRHGLLSGLL